MDDDIGPDTNKNIFEQLDKFIKKKSSDDQLKLNVGPCKKAW